LLWNDSLKAYWFQP